ncbi:hypothetical protein KY284_007745 [Solanum tuberosum]|nr:hypothetical protein KY284_007745 [Solanum tuberosum]
MADQSPPIEVTSPLRSSDPSEPPDGAVAMEEDIINKQSFKEILLDKHPGLNQSYYAVVRNPRMTTDPLMKPSN